MTANEGYLVLVDAAGTNDDLVVTVAGTYDVYLTVTKAYLGLVDAAENLTTWW